MIAFVGPPFEEGPLPAIVYFALSKEESLYHDPYNQPVVHLKERRVRIFSLSLPDHGFGLNPLDAMGKWAKRFEEGEDPLSPFFESTASIIQELVQKEIILPGSLGLMGLSRGGLIAGHLATRISDVVAWTAFAPLTKLTHAQEFHRLANDPVVHSLNLDSIAAELSKLPVRFYIGNRDKRVGTPYCFNLVERLTDLAYEQGIRSPPIELIISPSIGQMGHGTPKSIFCAGADWLAEKLGI